MSALPASCGWLWMTQGMALLRRNPSEFLSLQLAYLLCILIMSIIPILGQIVWLLLVPGFCLGLMQACQQVHRGQSVWSEQLLDGLKMPQLASQLRLGIVWLAGTLLTSAAVGMVFSVVGDETSWKILSGQAAPDRQSMDSGNLLLACSVAALVNLPFIMALWFAPMLTSWRGMPPGKAMFFSFFTLWRNARAFIIMGLSIIGLYFAGMLLAALASFPLSLIFGPQMASLLLLPPLILPMFALFYCSLYCSWLHLFGEDTAAKDNLIGAMEDQDNSLQ